MLYFDANYNISNQNGNYNKQYSNKNIVLNYIKNTIEPAIDNFETYNFYLTNYDKIFTSDVAVKWLQSTFTDNSSTGYFGNIFDNFPIKVGSYTTSNLKYIETGNKQSINGLIAPTTTLNKS